MVEYKPPNVFFCFCFFAIKGRIKGALETIAQPPSVTLQPPLFTARIYAVYESGGTLVVGWPTAARRVSFGHTRSPPQLLSGARPKDLYQSLEQHGPAAHSLHCRGWIITQNRRHGPQAQGHVVTAACTQGMFEMAFSPGECAPHTPPPLTGTPYLPPIEKQKRWANTAAWWIFVSGEKSILLPTAMRAATSEGFVPPHTSRQQAHAPARRQQCRHQKHGPCRPISQRARFFSHPLCRFFTRFGPLRGMAPRWPTQEGLVSGDLWTLVPMLASSRSPSRPLHIMDLDLLRV